MEESLREQAPYQVALIAEKLLEDIADRGLQAGDRYFSSAEVGDMFGVHRNTASKAMKLLAQKKILVRRQRSGTFIGPGITGSRETQVQFIMVVLPSQTDYQQWLQADFIQGIHRVMPEANVQFTFLPDHDEVAYVKKLIEINRPQLKGIIAVSCPAEVYDYFHQSKIPAVIYGTPYAHQMDYCYIDLDHHAAAKIMIEYLIAKDKRDLLVILSEYFKPGESEMLDGIHEIIFTEHLPVQSLKVRKSPKSLDAFSLFVKKILSDSQRPNGIITNNLDQAKIFSQVAKEFSLTLQEDLVIIFEHEGQRNLSDDQQSFACAVANMAFVEIAEQITTMLDQIGQDDGSARQQSRIPVRLSSSLSTSHS